jgi:hypothetical protein
MHPMKDKRARLRVAEPNPFFLGWQPPQDKFFASSMSQGISWFGDAHLSIDWHSKDEHFAASRKDARQKWRPLMWANWLLPRGKSTAYHPL